MPVTEKELKAGLKNKIQNDHRSDRFVCGRPSTYSNEKKGGLEILGINYIRGVQGYDQTKWGGFYTLKSSGVGTKSDVKTDKGLTYHEGTGEG